MRTTAAAALGSLRCWWFEYTAVIGLTVGAVFDVQAAIGALMVIGPVWLLGFRHLLRRQRRERRELQRERLDFQRQRQEFMEAIADMSAKLDAAAAADDRPLAKVTQLHSV